MSDCLLLCGGILIDGTDAAAPVRSDLLIERGRIADIAPAIQAPTACVLDASGLVVAPGFIDAHSHSDTTAFLDPSAQGRIFDGVTTEVNGSCGLSLFPLASRSQFNGTSLKRQGIEPDWRDAAGYLARLDAVGSAVNRAFLVGHGAIRDAVMGYEA